MNQIFSIAPPFRVPDGTLVSPFLNARDSESDLPFDLLDGFSMAAGIIEPHSASKIHIMPFVTQVTFVRSGVLTVKMKEPQSDAPYALTLAPGQAVLTEPQMFFQLINDSDAACEVLYIVSPAYTFAMAADGRVLYDDSVVIDEDWPVLASAGWQPTQAMPTETVRASAIQHLAHYKQSTKAHQPTPHDNLNSNQDHSVAEQTPSRAYS